MDLMADIVSHLSDSLGCRVSMERPANPPTEMVTVTRVGGGGSRFLERPRIAVHAWAGSESAAYRLGVEVANAMLALPDNYANVAEVSQDSLYSNIYPDGTRRWSGVYVIICNR